MSATELKPCPFCGQELEQRNSKYNPYARCATPDCAGGKLPLISLDVPGDIERWNRRGREQALAAHLEWLHGEIELHRDFGLGFALCHMDFMSTREAIKREQEKLGALLEAKPETSLARLKAEALGEVLPLIELLGNICRAAHHLAEDTCDEGGERLTVPRDTSAELEDALDACEHLPEPVEGIVSDGWCRALRTIRRQAEEAG